MVDATARTTIAVHVATKRRMRALMADGQTYDEWIDEQLRVHEGARWAELEATSYAEIPEEAPDEWGSLAEHVSLLSAGAIASLPDDEWT